MGNFYIGTKRPKSIYVGTQKVKSLWLGTQKVWTAETPEYTLIDHITSTGYEYIDTGITATQGTKIYIKYKQTELNSDSFYAVMGARTRRRKDSCYILSPGTSGAYVLTFGSEDANCDLRPTINEVMSAVVGRDRWFIERGEYTQNGTFTDQSSFESTGTIRIFDISNATGTNNRKLVGTVYEATIYEEDIITHNYKPAIRNSDNELGLLDTVTNQFLPNASGSGGFTTS